MKDQRRVWISWINSDLTEGKGHNVPDVVCELEATALRLAHKANTQGSPGSVEPFDAVLVDGKWCAPVEILGASREDVREQEKITKAREAAKRARAAGLSDEDIAALGGR